MIALDLKQNGKKIGLRALLIIGIVLILFLMGGFGAFANVEPMLERIPEYLRDILGFKENTDMLNGRNWLLVFSIIIELYFIFIAFMDTWDYVTVNEEKQRYLFLGNQLYTRTEYVLQGYFFLLIQFLIVWIPYKLMLMWMGGTLFAGMPTLLYGVAIYIVIIALGYVVSIVGSSHDISPEFLYLLTIFSFAIGNIHKFFAVINARLIEQGNFPNERFIELYEKTKGLNIFSLPSYFNPYRVENMGVALKTFGIGIIVTVILLLLAIFLHQKKEY